MKRNYTVMFKLWLVTMACSLGAVAQAKQNLESKLDTIILPELYFDEATIHEGIDFLGRRSVELDTAEKDPEQRGINFVILKSGQPSYQPSLTERIAKQKKVVKESEVQMLKLAKDSGFLEGGEAIHTEVYRVAELRYQQAKFYVVKLRNHLKSTMELDGDDLVKSLAAEDESHLMAHLYREYIAVCRDLVDIDDDEKKKIVIKRQTVLKEMLLDTAKSYRRSLATDFDIEERNLESAKMARDNSIEVLQNYRKRSIEYRAVVRDYDLKFSALVRMEKRAAEEAAVERPKLGASNLRLKNVPLRVALDYVTQQIGLSYAVQNHAVVIGRPEEIAAMK